MKERVKVMGNTAILKVISGRPGDADTGLILRGSSQCFELAEILIEAGERIQEYERLPLETIEKSRRKF